MPVACLSVRGAAVTIPVVAARAVMNCENFMLVEGWMEDNSARVLSENAWYGIV